uniref:Putative type I PKS n=1 Tax=Streptomyces antibioticus TaxID=1890 RepID=G9VYW0_STRAT|nr:putative type I PKS [Streptomyces antibioticus]
MSDDPKLVAYLRRVTAELYETRARLHAAEQGDEDDPVVVVGMGCRFPGGVRSPQDLWEVFAEGGDVITEFPRDRGWDVDALYDPETEAPRSDRTYVREGGFLADAAEFDPVFFGISPREALVMDPQQRLLLEVSWHALESAGIDPAVLRGSQTGVFVGLTAGDYAVQAEGIPADLVGQVGFNNTGAISSGRLSYTLGLQGPALTVDTACSSALVSIHLAAQSLRSGESSLALAGGATVIGSPVRFVEFSQQRALAPDGRCKPFSAAADGTSWSEGAGVVVLERLSDARRNGHQVLAVVRGSAVNQDGASNGLTAPNGQAQQRLIRDALSQAGLGAHDVDAVEAHGTGTMLGDPIEAQALAGVYSQGREPGRPLWIGSAKSNLGHTQAAAGIAGVIKMVMAMNHGHLPATLHVDAPSPHVEWAGSGVAVLSRAQAWPDAGRARRSAVSAFGMSGTNAHVILEQSVEQKGDRLGDGERWPAVVDRSTVLPVLPFTVSAPTAGALAVQVRQLLSHVSERPDTDVLDLAYSLATTRAHHAHRAVVLGRRLDELTATLARLGNDEPTPDAITGRTVPNATTAFLFPGQGSQWHRMGAELLESSAVFRDQVAACEEALAPFVDWSLTSVLRGEPQAASLERVDVLQPTLVAVMISLAELWRSYGVTPSAVAGHSQGEIAPAWLSGALSLSDAMRVVALRSRALKELSGLGGMASVALPAEQVREMLAAWGGRLEVGALNGTQSTVVSGDPDALAELLVECAARDIRAQRIPVDYASHSSQVERIRDQVVDSLEEVRPRPVEVPFVSGVTGDWVDAEAGRLDAEYWYRSLREAVRFERATRSLLADGHRVLVEVSPHPVLIGGVRETVDDGGGTASVLGTLRRDEGGMTRFLHALAEAHVAGAGVDWHAVFEGTGARRTELPGYAFQRDRYWLDSVMPAIGPTIAQAADSPGALAGRLAALSPAERADALESLIAGYVAVVLKYPSAADVPVEETFRDLGFESVTAIELRNRIAAATGVDVKLTDVLNYPTVTDLAEFVGERLPEADLAGPGLPAAADAPAESSDSIATLYLRGVEAGRTRQAMGLARAASLLRTTFGPEQDGAKASLSRLTTGTAGLPLVCTVAPVAPLTDAAYSFLASALPEPRDVWTVRPPGFGEGEPLPATLTDLFEAQRRALVEQLDGDAIVVVGYSSGGWLAHGLAAHLEAAGRPAAAVVLFDVYLPVSQLDTVWTRFLQEQASRSGTLSGGRSATLSNELSAMGGYHGLFDGWRPGRISAPTLHIRASEALPGLSLPAPDAMFPPELCHSSASLPGNHFTMLSQHSEAAAKTVNDWLAEVL